MHKFSEIKLAIVALFSTLGAFLGWKGVMAVVWVAVMALDYISGTAAACKNGEWSSKIARQGIWHKAGMGLVVVASALADMVLAVAVEHIPIGLAWPDLLLPLVLAWYTVTDLGSVVENAVKMGAPVPRWLTKILAISKKAVDAAGDSAVDKAEE